MGRIFPLKTVGIICEYNPFHLGHARQFRLIREQLGAETRIVCVMSGNYVQRGMPAMWDKLIRAETALRCGADLVLELPITGVLQSAEGFARTGVEILNRLGCVDYLCFGAECGNEAALMEMAGYMDSSTFQQDLKDGMAQGLPYAAARQAALHDREQLLSKPNNILGLEYCRAILQLHSSMQPMAVLRNGDYHDQKANQIEPSATAVRSLYPNGDWQNYVPAAVSAVLEHAPWYHITYGERALLARLRGLSNEEWENCAHGSEGLWSKAMKAARSKSDYSSIADAIKSKRYPMTRIHRLLLCAYLGISDADLKQSIPYIRILASNTSGRELLRDAKNRADLMLVNTGQRPSDSAYYRMECRCTDLYTLFAAPDHQPVCGVEQTARIILSE